MILQDSAGNFWQILVSSDGVLHTVLLSPPKTSTTIIDPTGHKWTLSVNTDGTLKTSLTQ